MQRRLLAAGEPFWGEGDKASSLGVVERGLVGVKNGGRLLGVLFPKMVLGESAILGLDGHEVRRTASVYALEDETVVAEYPADMVRQSFGVGVPRLVLRTLCGQVCRNALLTVAAHPGHSAVETSLMGLIQGVAACERQLREVDDWDRFLVVFRLLYHLREGSDAMRDELLPSRGEISGTIVRASEIAKSLFKADDVAEHVQPFLESERQRRRHAGLA
jgi:Cyclic nucleotide-binding domain